MATLASLGGNWLTAGSWALCNATAALDSEYATQGSSTSFVYSSTFMPGAITVDAVLIKLASRVASPTGTISIELNNHTDTAVVKTVVANVSAIENYQSPTGGLGWYLFKFDASVLLLAGKAYKIGIKSSVSSEVTLYRDITSGNWSRQLRTTTTQAPVAADKTIVIGEIDQTSPSQSAATKTITINETASTDYGAIDICKRGVLTSGVAASTNYVLKVSGNINVYAGAEFSLGTSGTPVPSTSTMTLTLDSTTAVEFGIEVRAGATFSAYGTKAFTSSPSNHFTLVQEATVIGSDTKSVGALVDTSGTTVTWKEGAKFDTGWAGTFTINGVSYTILGTPTSTSITATTTIGSNTGATFAKTGGGAPTVLNVDDTTGWAANDSIIACTSTRRYQDNEVVTIATVNSGTQITASSGFTAYHSGLNDVNGNLRAVIGNRTRNVKIGGNSLTNTTYINIQDNTTVNLSLCDIFNIGSNTNNKFGIDVKTITGTFNANLSVFRDTHASGIAINITSTSGSATISVTKCIFYDVFKGISNVATTNTYTFTNNLVVGIRNLQNNVGFILYDIGGNASNNYFCGSGTGGGGVAGGIYPAEVGKVMATGCLDNNIFMGCGSGGITLYQGVISGTVNNCRFVRTSGMGVNSNSSQGHQILTFKNCNFYGDTNNSTASFFPNIRLISCLFEAGVNLVSGWGPGGSHDNAFGPTIFDSCTIGTTNNFSNRAWSQNQANILFRNCTFNANYVNDLNTMNVKGSFFLKVVSLNHNNVAGDNRIWCSGGGQTTFSMATDSTIFRSAAPSLRLVPGFADAKLISPVFRVAVANGSVLTPSIWVRESLISAGDAATYNGSKVRMRVMANAACGISDDTTLMTATSASSGAWQLLTGSTAIVTGDGVLEFVLECDGTTGWVNIADFTCVGQVTSGLRYWDGPGVAGPLATIEAAIAGAFIPKQLVQGGLT